MPEGTVETLQDYPAAVKDNVVTLEGAMSMTAAQLAEEALRARIARARLELEAQNLENQVSAAKRQRKAEVNSKGSVVHKFKHRVSGHEFFLPVPLGVDPASIQMPCPLTGAEADYIVDEHDARLARLYPEA